MITIKSTVKKKYVDSANLKIGELYKFTYTAGGSYICLIGEDTKTRSKAIYVLEVSSAGCSDRVGNVFINPDRPDGRYEEFSGKVSIGS